MAEIRSLGKYPLLGLIGRGSMGTVYASKDPDTGTPLAVKVVHSELLRDTGDDFRALLRTEALAASALHHPGILQVLEYGEEKDAAYLVMEYSPGTSLQEHFNRHVRFSRPRAVNLMTQLLDALQYAHDRGVWHRDIKPANLIVSGEDRLQVADFGIARLESADTQVTVLGTPGYIAPESYQTDSVDQRVDVFAAGVVLYQLLTDTPPFSGTPDRIMSAVCHETPPAPSVAGHSSELRPFDPVVLTALARQPTERFASAADFRTALLRAQAPTPRAARRP
ncbi:MAG: serine/threonine protein kinase [Proteobacteria bacterium]|nr:serine/threonine protein kinase [Pseudomonadota bacterium]